MNDLGPDARWAPLSPQAAAMVLAPLGVRWWLAGGLAIDRFVGRETRTHGDIDIAALRGDAPKFTELLPTWDIRIPHDGALLPWDGAPLAAEQHQFWMHRREIDAWEFEVLFEQHEDDTWIFRRDARIRMLVDDIGHTADDGVPVLRPEIALLYKAARSHTIARNTLDFNVAAPLLDARARSWLASAVALGDPAHPWIARLG